MGVQSFPNLSFSNLSFFLDVGVQAFPFPKLFIQAFYKLFIFLCNGVNEGLR